MRNEKTQWETEFDDEYVGDLSHVNGGGKNLQVLVPIFEVRDFIRQTLLGAIEGVMERKVTTKNMKWESDTFVDTQHVSVEDIQSVFREMGVEISSDK